MTAEPCIRAECPGCRRVKADAKRLPKDPAGAVTVIVACPDCGGGLKEESPVYVDADGVVIELVGGAK